MSAENVSAPRCLRCALSFCHWALRRKRRGGPDAIAAGPELGASSDRASRRSDGSSKGPQTFRPEPTNRQIEAVQAESWGLVSAWGFSGPKTGNPFSKRGRSLARHSQ